MMNRRRLRKLRFNRDKLKRIPIKVRVINIIVLLCCVIAMLTSCNQSPYTREEIHEKKILVNRIEWGRSQSNGLSVSDVEILFYCDDLKYCAYIKYDFFDSIRSSIKALNAECPIEILVGLPTEQSIIDTLLNRNKIVTFRTEAEEIYPYDAYFNGYSASGFDWLVCIFLCIVVFGVVLLELLAYGAIS